MEKYDPALLGILQNEGKVAPFLDAILGFLYRRTDFFRIMKSENESLGFPPGVAKKLLMNIYSKYEILAQKDATKLEEIKRARETKQIDKQQKSSKLDTSGDSSVTNEPAEKDKVPSESPQNSAVPQTPNDERGAEEVVDPSDKEIDKEDEMDTDSKPAEIELDHNDDEEKKISNDNNDSGENEDPELARQRRLLQANPLTYNGAEREDYFWSQTITEADLRVKIPKFIVKGKQVRVDIAKKHIRVSHQKEDGSWNQVVDKDLVWEVNTEESMWTLTPGEFVHINLEKREERWWECVFVDEPKINTRKIDCSRPMTDLDDEAQAKIEEMMYNQRQKQLGLPQSHEQKTREMLRKAWDAEGSPFKGQPFDPSRFNVDANGVVNMNQS